MEKLYIICLEDQREVLDAVVQDLTMFQSKFRIEECETAREAHELMQEINQEGGLIPLIISDHVMPGKTGIEFLTEIHRDDRFSDSKKILLTGLATHQDTITAINQASIDHYLEKPWETADLQQAASRLITEYLIDKGLDYQHFQELLDRDTLLEKLKNQI
jgi:two-component system chemotaxis response regulator CheY